MHNTTLTSTRRRALVTLVAAGLLASSCGSGGTDDAAESIPDMESAAAEPEQTTSSSSVTTEPSADIDPASETEASNEPPDEPETASEAYELDLGGGAGLMVPEGGPADVSATPIDAEPTNPDAEVVAAFELLPDGAVFDDPVLLSLTIPELDPGAGAELALTLTSADGSVESASGSVDGDRIVYEIPHFTTAKYEQVYITNLIVSPSSPQPVGARFDVQFDGPQNAAIDWKAIVHQGTDTAAVEVIDRSSATLECAKAGTSNLFLVSPDIIDPDGNTHSIVAYLDVTCVEVAVTADQILLSENHSDATLLTDPNWFSVIMARFEAMDEGLVTPILDNDCNGEIGAGDEIIFGPVPVGPEGAAVMGLERFGCVGVVIFPTDATFESDTFPFRVTDQPTQLDNGSWVFHGSLEQVEVDLVVTDTDTNAVAIWRVAGTDGEMSLIP